MFTLIFFILCFTVNNYYSLYECAESEINVHVLNPYKKLLFGLEDKKEICNLIANKETKIITITVTEKGYHYNTVNKSLDLNDDIKNDFENGFKAAKKPKLVASK